MKIYKTKRGIVIEKEGNFFLSGQTDWDEYINKDDLFDEINKELSDLKSDDGIPGWLISELQAPIGTQEVWAAGVTYLRSRDARMDEAKESGGATFYDKVYDAERPELFFKATPHRVVGHNGKVRIRRDSNWNVPEPELTLLISSSGKIIGYTIGNDMSSRSIEGENPLYLPQAKTYESSAALGPCIFVSTGPLNPETEIYIEIKRGDTVMYSDKTAISKMKRKQQELVEYLYRECTFPSGCFLMTGTCLVPPNDFTLRSSDMVTIQIDGIGTLQNIVA